MAGFPINIPAEILRAMLANEEGANPYRHEGSTFLNDCCHPQWLWI